MGHENLKARTKTFALDVVCFCADLPRTPEIGHVRGQLQRAATSVGANYRAACRSKSNAGFVAKLGTVEEEADESAFWLEFIKSLDARRNLKLDDNLKHELNRLWDEGCQLLAITIRLETFPPENEREIREALEVISYYRNFI